MSDGAPSDAFALRRQAMVTLQLRDRGIRDERVLEAMARVPRHEFVPPDRVADAYGDHPLPIGEGQTISQPYIVAAMVEALALREEDSVLEIGTGSGYQTAILCELCRSVYSIERHASLCDRAPAKLARLGYTNFKLRAGDGSAGWPEAAPFDGIVVSAAVPRVPVALFEQLREGGRLILPVGSQISQELQLVRKQSGVAMLSHLDGCRFVPLVGASGF
jgi:protein-L-isoaspartate(D-aspartate) O-methyltransferase